MAVIQCKMPSAMHGILSFSIAVLPTPLLSTALLSTAAGYLWIPELYGAIVTAGENLCTTCRLAQLSSRMKHSFRVDERVDERQEECSPSRSLDPRLLG